MSRRKDELLDGLSKTVEQVLEEAAFVFVEPDEERSVPDESVVEAFVAVSGPVVGDLVFTTTDEFARELAANLLGKEADDISEAAGTDAVGETLNIIAGHFMADAYGTERHFRLGAPRVSRRQGNDSLFSRSAPIQFLADGEHPVAATFRIRESLIPGEPVEELVR